MRTIAGAGVLGLTLAMASLVPQVAGAEGLVLSTGNTYKPRAAMFRTQTQLMDTRLSAEYGDSGRLRPDDGALQLGMGGIVPRYSGRYRGEYLTTAKAAAARHGVPEDLFLRLVDTESGWNPTALSPKGAQGLAQLMPGTAQLLGVDPTDPNQNLEGGARYLRMMYDRFGDWRLALAAYNAGPMAVDKHGNIPPFLETQNYVVAIFGS